MLLLNFFSVPSDKSLPLMWILHYHAVFMRQKVRWSSVNDNPHHFSLPKASFRCQF